MTLAALYERRSREPSDINEHLETLRRYASQCQHVTEFGVRSGVSTTALLAGMPEQLVSYDWERRPEVDELERLAEGRWSFVLADVLTVTIAETDLLFIDTYHTGEQLRQELALHAEKVKNCIILHDTESFGMVGEHGKEGLWPAVVDFIDKGTFCLFQHFKNNNGLTILSRCQT
jgi:hypothetical protein